MTRNESAYLYRDLGVDHLTDFEHLYKIVGHLRIVPSTDLQYFSSYSNSVEDFKACLDGGRTCCGMSLYWWNCTDENRFRLFEYYSNSAYTDNYNGTCDTDYYITLTKTGTSFVAKIYSDSARTNLLDTLSLTLQADHNFRYLYCCNSHNSGGTQRGDGDIYNLDINEDPCSITTGSATSISTNSATLNGTIDDMGDETSIDVTFEYGKTAAYGDETTGSTETSAGSIEEAISGLDTGTTYHFRIKAVGTYGTVYGDDNTFDTLSGVIVKKVGGPPRKLGLPTPINIGI